MFHTISRTNMCKEVKKLWRITGNWKFVLPGSELDPSLNEWITTWKSRGLCGTMR